MTAASLSLPDDRWAELAVRFNLAPFDYMHDSWLENFANRDLLRALEPHRAAGSRLSRHLLEILNLHDRFFVDFSEPRSRLALLDSASLENLLLYTGLALRAEEIRKLLDGAQVAKLRKILGAGAFEFAAKQVPLLGGVPEFAYEPGHREPRGRLILIGALFALSRGAWSNPAYARRLVLRLPRDLSQDLLSPWPEPANNTENGKLPGLMTRLIKEFIAPWHPLFA